MISASEAAKSIGMALLVGLIAVFLFGAGGGLIVKSCIESHYEYRYDD